MQRRKIPRLSGPHRWRWRTGMLAVAAALFVPAVPAIAMTAAPSSTAAPSASTASTSTASTSAAAEEVHAVGAGECLAVPQPTTAIPPARTQTAIEDCTGAANELWTPTTSSALTVYDGTYCLDARHNGVTSGTVVQVYPCNGGTNQEWTVNANGTITGVQSGLCLTAESSGLVDIATCTSGSDQQWTLGTTTPPPPTNPFGDPNLVSMFDGKDLSGWTTADSKGWIVNSDDAIQSTGDARGWIYYNKKFASSFRWIFDVRQVTGGPSPHNPTQLFWGTITPIRDALSAIQVQAPTSNCWDYQPGENNACSGKFTVVKDLGLSISNWSQCEILADGTTGTAKYACCPLTAGEATCNDAEEAAVFTSLAAVTDGPVAIQVHNAGIEDEYKGLWFESPVTYEPGTFITASG
jgi:hypothetical protein